MRGKVWFACLFALSLWLGLRAFGQASLSRSQLPPQDRITAETWAPAAAQEENGLSPMPQAVRFASRPALALPAFRRAPAPLPQQAHYRVAWQAFHLEGKAG